MSGTELDRLRVLKRSKFICGADPSILGLTILELTWLRWPILVWAESSRVGFTSDDMDELGGGREGGGAGKKEEEEGSTGAARLS